MASKATTTAPPVAPSAGGKPDLKAVLRSQTIYRLKDVATFDDAIADTGAVTAYGPVIWGGAKGMLYAAKQPDQQDLPAWAKVLIKGMGQNIKEFGKTASNSAVLVLEGGQKTPVHYAFTFGFGRHLLSASKVCRGFGMQAALSLIYPKVAASAGFDAARLRSVDAKTVAARTLHTRRQADRQSSFEEFGVDVDGDLLRAVTGRPYDDAWGPLVTGVDAINLRKPVALASLAKLIKDLEAVFRSRDYKERFGWIDKVTVITDPTLIRNLEDEVANSLRSGSVNNLDLALPEIIDWRDVEAFSFGPVSEKPHPDLALADLIADLTAARKLAKLEFRHLKERFRLATVDAAGRALHEWPVSRCLSGEVSHGGKTYLVNDGEFLAIEAAFIAALDKEIDNVPATNLSLPASTKGEAEDTWNRKTAKQISGLLLDKKLVKIARSTSPIELCDVLVGDAVLVHAKRKFGSSDLSHLFAQGSVVGDLLVTSEEFRVEARALIKREEVAQGKPAGSFDFMKAGAAVPSKITVVFAVIGPWGTRKRSTALPFFSKVNLRRHARELRRMGYKVEFAQVEAS